MIDKISPHPSLPKRGKERNFVVLIIKGCLVLVLLFLLASCLPKRPVVYDRRKPLPAKKEAVREEKPSLSKIEGIEKRETRGVQYGVASWYGPDFHGKPTSSGEIYDMYQLTCAHNTLALGTTVIVTNLENGKSLELKVNDRGPFLKERIIDLSYAAAKVLGIWEKGTAFVKVETIGPWIEEVPRITLQVGSFTDDRKAQIVADQLRRTFENVHVTPVETSIQTYYRVRIGPFETRESALSRAEQLSQMGYQVLITTR
ncbi:MAG TPA: septal ring lytic transglycosylase RlpA family protein [Thermodesulfobacteriota bacterium]|nr:septal ring lytic transglycosylase RlpA family protein [Thermodesulfobacteriota bacterium]